MRTRKQTIAILLKLKEKGLLREISGRLSKASGEFALSTRLDIGIRPISFKVSRATAERWGGRFSAGTINDILQDIPPQDRIALNLRGIYALDAPAFGRSLRKHAAMARRRDAAVREYAEVESTALAAHVRGRIFLNADLLSETPAGIPESFRERYFQTQLRKTLIHEVGHNLDRSKGSPGNWRAASPDEYRSSTEHFVRAAAGKTRGEPITETDRGNAMEWFAHLYSEWITESAQWFKTLEKYQPHYRAFRRLMENR